MNLHKKFLFAATGICLLVSSGCRKYLDTNTNPNIATDATVDLILPTTQVTIAVAMGVDPAIYGGIWGQYFTQNPNSSQYRQLERYAPTSPDFDRVWTLFYASAGEDLFQLEKKAKAQNRKQYQAIAMLQKAYMFQVMTDAWGDIPYRDALKAQAEDGGVVSPGYDDQLSIYNSLITLVDSAKALIDPNDPSHPGSDDLLYGGDMELWYRFANTLQLKMLLRLSEKSPGVASAGIARLSGEPFIEDGMDAQINFTSTPGNQNPLYAEAVGLSRTQNLVASKTVIDSMNSNKDARIEVFFVPANNGSYIGVKQGNYNAALTPGNYSYPSPAIAGDAKDPESAPVPVKLMTSYESYFLQAEATARGWLTGGASAQSLFEDGISSNFSVYGVDDSATTAYMTSSNWGVYPAGATITEQVKYIVTQKWFSMTGNQSFEAWTEWRRTGYPTWFQLSETRLLNDFPARFLYPDVEITRNSKFPGTLPVTSKVAWDVN